MKTYRPKKLIQGYKLGLQGGHFIAIPMQNITVDSVKVFYQESQMVIEKGKSPILQNSFRDKYGRGSYTLYYYEWIPEALPTQIDLFPEGGEQTTHHSQEFGNTAHSY